MARERAVILCSTLTAVMALETIWVTKKTDCSSCPGTHYWEGNQRSTYSRRQHYTCNKSNLHTLSFQYISGQHGIDYLVQAPCHIHHRWVHNGGYPAYRSGCSRHCYCRTSSQKAVLRQKRTSLVVERRPERPDTEDRIRTISHTSVAIVEESQFPFTLPVSTYSPALPRSPLPEQTK